MGNYLAVLARNFTREKLYTTINIVGLAFGLASCLVLGLFLKSELTYDKHFAGDRPIYRIANEFINAGKPESFAITSDALGPMIADEYPDRIQKSVRFRNNANNGGIAIRPADQPETVFYWENSYFVDPYVFDVFPHDILAGDPATALQEGGSVAISQTMARKYFGNEDPIGKQLVTDSGNANTVRLVFADLPANTHLKYDILFSNNLAFLRLNDNPTQRRAQLGGPQALTYTFLLMHPSFRESEWEQMSQDFYQKYMVETLRAVNIEWRSWLQPMRRIHLDNDDVQYDLPTGNRAYIFGAAAVALIILVIACINYMNLATARATRRARSVAFRKILGANRLSLALQFMGEALLFSLAALLLAVLLVEAALRFTPLNSLMEGKVVLDLASEPQLLLWLVGAAVGVGLLSGLYPAFYMSSWAPITALTGKQGGGKGNLHLREFLVLVQFTISAAAIACTLLMVAQMHYLSNQPLGFERENRLMVSLRGASTIEKLDSIRNEMLADSRILGVAVTGQTPDRGDRAGITIVQTENNEGVMEQQLFNVMALGQDYEKVMGLKIAQGRDLTSRLLTDIGTNMLVNQALVKAMNWSEPLGKQLTLGGNRGRVVGVVEDFNFKSLKHRIEPLAMMTLQNDMSQVQEINRPFQQRFLILQLSGNDISGALAHAEKVMAGADPRHPFEYEFLDEALDKQYTTELALTKLIGIFAAISILIACMGLFGLAAFTTEQRTREIGTRKVLGATAWQIVGLLAKRILVLVVVASVLAGVGAYFAVDEWLAGFAYRASINPLIFVLAAAVAAAVAFATVAAQSWRTANADPVGSLRHV
jgi:putative ABC transport system permease protein